MLKSIRSLREFVRSVRTLPSFIDSVEAEVKRGGIVTAPFCGEHSNGTLEPCDECAEMRRGAVSCLRDDSEGRVGKDDDGRGSAVSERKPRVHRKARLFRLLGVARDRRTPDMILAVLGEIEDGPVVMQLYRHGLKRIARSVLALGIAALALWAVTS